MRTSRFVRLFAVGLILALNAAPSIAAEQVKPQASPPAAAATAQSSNSAVVSKGLTTATVTVPASDKPQTFEIPVKELIDALLPYIVALIGTIITGLGGLITWWFKKKFNIDIDQSHRNAWQQSAQNAAGALLAKGAVAIAPDGKVTVKSEEMAKVVNIVIARVPDAIKHFGFTPEDVQHLIEAKIPQVITGSVPPTVAVDPTLAPAQTI